MLTSSRKRLVVLESPLAGDFALNKHYARLAMRDACLRGEAPYASHLMFDQHGLLDDTIPDEREMGLMAGLFWGDAGGEASVVYTDLGISGGMQRGIDRAHQAGRPVEYRTLPNWAELREAFETLRQPEQLRAALDRIEYSLDKDSLRDTLQQVRDRLTVLIDTAR